MVFTMEIGAIRLQRANSTQRLTSSRLSRLARQPLNYFIPDWEDYLDPEYDFVNDRFSWDGTERRRLYAHELFKWRPLYDGIVTSLGHIFMAKGFIKDGLKPGVKVTPARQYLHLRRQHLVMGDCGAFSYRRQVVPPFSTEQVVKLYTSLGVDIGASIDHIPFGDVEENGKLRPLRSDEIESRIELTTKLAKEFLSTSEKSGKFLPMGVIQARSSDEYASLAEEYIKAGYQYIALGGLVPKVDQEIQVIAQAVVSRIGQAFPVSSSSIRIHLFGVLREKLLPDLKNLGIASFDSGSYLRKAWLRSDKNYLSNSGEWYTAIRVPFSSDSRFQRNAISAGMTVDRLEELEKKCLQLLRQFDPKADSLSELLDTVIAYDSMLLRTSDTENLRNKYEKTLRDAPWEKCKCPVCQALGIDVLIFRGFNRNKRRGFHNTWVFFKQLRRLRA